MNRNKPGRNWLASLRRLRYSRMGSKHNDRVMGFTQWSAFLIVPVLITAFVVLTVWPGDTELLFAWTSSSRMTPLMIGAAYAGGAYFFSRVFLTHHWHKVGLGFWPATVFALLGGLITFLEYDNFNHSSIAFVIWVAGYATTVWLIPLAWLRNRSQDPRMPSTQEIYVPKSLVNVWVGLGIANLILSALMIILPGPFVDGWPWKINPIGIRVIGSMFAAFGTACLGLAVDRRWSATRTILETLVISLALLLAGMIRAWSDLNLASPLLWFLVAWILIILAGSARLFWWAEHQKTQVET